MSRVAKREFRIWFDNDECKDPCDFLPDNADLTLRATSIEAAAEEAATESCCSDDKVKLVIQDVEANTWMLMTLVMHGWSIEHREPATFEEVLKEFSEDAEPEAVKA